MTPASSTAGHPKQGLSPRQVAAGWEVVALSLTLLACAPLLTPLLTPGIATTHDGFLHIQRLIALEAAASDGAAASRWLPDLAYGYGQPLLLYYAPLSYLPALALRSVGAGYSGSFETSSGLAVAFSALTMYLLGRALFGRLGAATAGIVYAALPYQMVDLYVRGALAESWAFVWMPLCALCLLRLARMGNLWWGAGLAVTLAGLVLTHNVTALLFLPALMLLTLVLATRNPATQSRWRMVGLSAGSMAVGLGLSAWFWLPAIAERGLVHIEQTIEPDLFASFFLRGWPPFRPDLLYDYQQPVSEALGYPIFWPQIGLVQTLVSIAGAIAVMRLHGVLRLVGIWALLLVVGGTLVQLRPLEFLYDLIPLLAFVQFPWRFLAVIGVGSAVLAGCLVEAAGPRILTQASLAVIVGVLSLLTATAQLRPEVTPVADRLLSVETIIRAELADYGLGTTHSGEYLPVSSGQRNANRLRKTMLDAGDDDRSAQPASSAFQIEALDWRPDRITVSLTSTASTPEPLVFHQFAFDGWTAKIDGMSARALATGDLGLLGVSVPPGAHTIEVHWSSAHTTMRRQGIVISAVALATLAFLLAAEQLSGRRRWIIAVALAAGVVVMVIEGPALSDLQISSTSGELEIRRRTVDDHLLLVGVRHDAARLRTDGLLLSHLFWFARDTVTTGYRATLEAVAQDGTVHRAPWIYEPLSRLWQRGELVPTTVAVRLPPDFPPGPALLRLTFEEPPSRSPIMLGSVTVPDQLETPAAAPVANGTPIGDGLQVAVTDTGSTAVRPGTPHDVVLRWQSRAAAVDRERELLVIAAAQTGDGEITSEIGRPGAWFAPLPFWQAGDIIEQYLRLNIPQTLTAGQFPVTVRIYTRALAHGGAAEPGASSVRLRGRPLAELPAGTLTVTP